VIVNKIKSYVTFYLDFPNGTFKKLFQEEIDKLQNLGITFSFRESRHDDMPEACINGYCVAGIADIKHELNSLITS